MRIFICNNKRRPPQASCGKRCDANHLAKYLQSKIAENEASLTEDIEVLKTKCLGRCLVGPTMVILPQKVWYSCSTERDIDELVSEHLVGGREVERLKMDKRLVRPAARQAVTSSWAR